MSDVALKTCTAAPAATIHAKPLRPALSVLAIAAVALLAGCTLPQRDSIVVGAVPDDYRTNHPIVIADKDEVLDLAVGASDRGATRSQRVSLEGFLSNYDRTATPVLKILAPSGAANDIAAADAAHDFARIARKNGVPASRILITSYYANAPETSAPVRVTYTATRAQTGKCGRWPEDILATSENKHYADFGCSYQNNIAAQVANPEDLLGPRKQSPIDAANRSAVIGEYQKAPPAFDPTISY